MKHSTIEIDDPIKEQLAELREMTRRTGQLHEIQVIQLKNWPLVVFAFAKSVTVRVVNHVEREETKQPEEAPSLDTPPPAPKPAKLVQRVEFLVTSHKGKAQSNINKRVRALEVWVKELLGQEWKILVKIDKKVVYGNE